MRNAKDIIGMAVIGRNDGAILGFVRDLIFDQDANRVAGLVLSEQDLFGIMDATVAPWREVELVGQDVILVYESNSRVKLRQHQYLHQLAKTRRDTMLSGTDIFTRDGRKLGKLADVVIDQLSGAVIGYEVSGGFVADTLHGKRFLPGTTELSLGDDVAIVPSSAAEELRKQLV